VGKGGTIKGGEKKVARNTAGERGDKKKSTKEKKKKEEKGMDIKTKKRAPLVSGN